MHKSGDSTANACKASRKLCIRFGNIFQSSTSPSISVEIWIIRWYLEGECNPPSFIVPLRHVSSQSIRRIISERSIPTTPFGWAMQFLLFVPIFFRRGGLYREWFSIRKMVLLVLGVMSVDDVFGFLWRNLSLWGGCITWEFPLLRFLRWKRRWEGFVYCITAIGFANPIQIPRGRRTEIQFPRVDTTTYLIGTVVIFHTWVSTNWGKLWVLIHLRCAPFHKMCYFLHSGQQYTLYPTHLSVMIFHFKYPFSTLLAIPI